MQTRMELMSWQDFERSVRQNKVVILPVGALEQHGPHLPLGTDTMVVNEIANRAAKRTKSILAPSITYGFKPQPGSSGGNWFSGTLSLDGSTLTSLVRDIVRELLRHRVRRLLILDGHYENSLFLNEGVDLALREIQTNKAKVVIARWYELVPESFFVKLFGKDFHGMALEHASKVETSLVMAINQSSVQQNRMKNDPPKRRENYTVFPENKSFIPKLGSLTTVFPSSTQRGEQVLEYASREVISIIKKEFQH